ncbi:MHC class I polypeptide-related sequence A-like [Panthera onca]
MAEAQGLWAEVLVPKTWDTETKDLRESRKGLRMTLADPLALPEAAIIHHREDVEERREGPFWLESVTGVGKAEEHRMGFVTAGWGQGSYSLQEIWGWEIREDNSTRGFGHFRYDGSSFPLSSR